jgi:hypothetical protein
MNWRVRAYLTPEQDLYHASKVYTGLCALHAQGRALVSFVTGRPAAGPAVLRLDVTRDGTTRRVAIDLHDRGDTWADQLLEKCDVYFKRSLHPPDLASLPPGPRAKVLPFGLNFACRGHGVTARVLGALGPRYAWRVLRSSLGGTGRDREALGVLKQFCTLPHVAHYEMAPAVPVEPLVLFQTRVWEPGEVYPDDPAEVNEGRVALVRALRRAFGESFLGGLVPTAHARRHYPDAVSDQPSRRGRYVALSKRALVGVYSRGLHHSLAFKLPEYLASSKAIVADGFRNQLPTPLEDGTHYLGFRDPDQCVEQCARLLAEPQRAAAMRRANYRYYCEEVAPAAHVFKCLEQVLAPGLGREPAART